jgi:hypothetical protein
VPVAVEEIPVAVEAAEPDGEIGEPDGEDIPERRAAEQAAERLLEQLKVSEARRLPPRLAALRPEGQAAGAILATVGGLLMVGVLIGVLYVVGRFL